MLRAKMILRNPSSKRDKYRGECMDTGNINKNNIIRMEK